MIWRLKNSGIRVFVIVWFGQLISLTGTQLTGFALGVWVFQRTGSVTRFALISVCTMLPGILISPLAGALVDRWDRRRAMLLSDSGAGLSTLVIVLLLLSDQLKLWHIYLATTFGSLFNAFQIPAYKASISLLVPKKHLGRASGMTQFSEAFAQIVSPALGGILLVTIQIWGVILIDFATFLFALITLLAVRIPRAETSVEGVKGVGTLWQETIFGWHYIVARPGLLGLLIFLGITNFTLGMVITLITPLVLSFSSAVVLGVVMSVAGLGMLFGSIVMSVWGGPKRRVMVILGFTLLQSMPLFLGGLEPNATLIAVAAFVFTFCDPFIFGSDQVLWQCKVAPDVQGRVFAVRHMVTWISFPFAFLAAGPLADHIFEPLLTVGGPLARSMGKFIGVGPGRGIGFMFMVMGLLTILITIAAYLYPRLRLVEQELPEAIPENVSETKF